MTTYEDFLEEFLGWGTDVHGEGHEDLARTLSNNFLLFDEVKEELDVGVGSGYGDAVQENVSGSLLFNGLTEMDQRSNV